MVISRSDRLKQLVGKGRDMKRLVSKKKHAVEHEAFELGLRHREVREAERRLSRQQQNPQQQLQYQQQVQQLLANGSRLAQLEVQHRSLGREQEVVDQRLEQLEVLYGINTVSKD